MKFEICVAVFASLICFSISQEFTPDDARSTPTAGKYSKHLIPRQTRSQTGRGG